MIGRESLPAMWFIAVTAALVACTEGPPGQGRQPYLDEWRVVVEHDDVDDLALLSVGSRLVFDNFANRGDIEVRFDPAQSGIRIEMQRFTIADDPATAMAAFERMQAWAYASPPTGTADDEGLPCFMAGTSTCHVRVHHESVVQPWRDGANLRVTLPAAWQGELELVTSDNLGEGVEYYPDRSDVAVWGLAGALSVELDSGNVAIAVASSLTHFEGCPLADTCELGGFDPACGCTQPTAIRVANAAGHASNVVIDLPLTSSLTASPHWYEVRLDRGDPEAGCTASIDCEDLGCVEAVDPDGAEVSATIGYPGAPALVGAGILVNAFSAACSDVEYVDDPTQDYGRGAAPSEQRGNLRVCTGCLAE